MTEATQVAREGFAAREAAMRKTLDETPAEELHLELKERSQRNRRRAKGGTPPLPTPSSPQPVPGAFHRAGERGEP